MLGFISNLSLRQRASFSFTIICIVLFSLVYFYSSEEISKGFLRLEEKDARTNLSRISDAIESESEAFISSLIAYAQWNDAYNYINVKKDPVFEAANLGNTLATLNLDIFSYRGADKKMVFGTNIDLNTTDETKILYAMSNKDELAIQSINDFYQMKELSKYTIRYMELT